MADDSAFRRLLKREPLKAKRQAKIRNRENQNLLSRVLATGTATLPYLTKKVTNLRAPRITVNEAPVDTEAKVFLESINPCGTSAFSRSPRWARIHFV